MTISFMEVPPVCESDISGNIIPYNIILRNKAWARWYRAHAYLLLLGF